ncbi:putative B3 domain-containing protein At3g24850 [Lactuca sativa]|uniref:putative B3 domain-containing protein At3g24850 n=1 Tax=Lactuca sativa TaxID=4236 RepID=UPI000CC4B56F|nr:putative B3 domain-containing protein At3g24850 [Lactuca sativa]
MGNILAPDAKGRNKCAPSACMGYEDDDTDEYYLNAGEDEDEEEDEAQREYYRKKIMELYEEKMKKFAREDALADQIKCEERKMLCKRPTKKIKMQQPKPTTQIVSNQVTQQLKQFITNNEMNGAERKKWKSTPTVEKNKKVEIVKNQITQELEEFITNKLKGKEAKVVIQKTLFSSDLRKNQNRLSMPMKQLKPDEFLRKNEKEDLENGMELKVGLLGPRLEMHKKPMMLKMWRMKSTKNYVLKTNWNEFVMVNEKDFKNKENTEIQVWSFRIDEDLCFAITFLEKDVEGQNDAT